VGLPDDLVAGPGELLLTLSRPGGEPVHAPCWAAVDTTASRSGMVAQPVGRATVRPTLDGALDDRAWRAAAVLSGLGRQARVLVLALDDGLAIAARMQRPDGRPPRATVAGRDRDLSGDDQFAVALSPAGADGPRYRLAVNPLGAICDQSATDRDLDLTTRLAVPGLPLLGATDGGWNLELMVPWAALGDLDAASFGLACETIRPGCEPATLRWPGDGLAARLTGLPDLSPFRLTTGPVEVSVEGVGAAAVLVVELPITNRTGRDFEGFAKAALERADGLSLAEAEVRVSNGGSGTVRWDFKPGQGAATLLWRIECAAAPTLRRTGRARL